MVDSVMSDEMDYLVLRFMIYIDINVNDQVLMVVSSWSNSSFNGN